MVAGISVVGVVAIIAELGLKRGRRRRSIHGMKNEERGAKIQTSNVIEKRSGWSYDLLVFRILASYDIILMIIS